MPSKYQRVYACATGSSCDSGKYGEQEQSRRDQYDYGGESNIGAAAGALGASSPVIKSMESVARRSRGE